MIQTQALLATSLTDCSCSQEENMENDSPSSYLFGGLNLDLGQSAA